MPEPVDVVVAGSGIVGLSVALEAVRRGLRVVVVERDDRPVGASVRNFGHGCVSAQSGDALTYALAARERWLRLRAEAGLWVQECGTVVVARSSEELTVLEQFADARPGWAELLAADQVLARVPVAADELLGGAFLPQDIRVDPRQAVPALADHLASLGVEFRLRTAALGAEPGVLHTSRGEIRAHLVVLALGHDLDQLLPGEAEAGGVTRCQLRMLRVSAPAGWIEPGLLTGTSLLRYSGFADCAGTAALRARFRAERPELLDAGVNHMLTQHPSGELIVGDTHAYGPTPSPFEDEALDELLLRETRRLLGVEDLVVKERWLGEYASAPDSEYLVAQPCPGVVGLAVTSGIGMTTALGLAPAVLDKLGVT